MKLLAFGIIAILGIGAIMILAETLPVGYLTFAQVEREQVFYSDWNPCFNVCKGMTSEYVGNNPDTGATQCLCQNGKLIETRDRMPKRIYATGNVLRDFSEEPPAYRVQQVADYCERVQVPNEAVNYRALCNTVGTEMCCKTYGIQGCSSQDLAVWPSVCVSKCIEDVRNQCRKAGQSQRQGLQINELQKVVP